MSELDIVPPVQLQNDPQLLVLNDTLLRCFDDQDAKNQMLLDSHAASQLAAEAIGYTIIFSFYSIFYCKFLKIN
jgi:hypothetical protein